MWEMGTSSIEWAYWMIFCSVAEMDNNPEALTLSELMAGQKIVKWATRQGRYSVHRGTLDIPHTSPSFSNCISIYSRLLDSHRPKAGNRREQLIWPIFRCSRMKSIVLCHPLTIFHVQYFILVLTLKWDSGKEQYLLEVLQIPSRYFQGWQETNCSFQLCMIKLMLYNEGKLAWKRQALWKFMDLFNKSIKKQFW